MGGAVTGGSTVCASDLRKGLTSHKELSFLNYHHCEQPSAVSFILGL